MLWPQSPAVLAAIEATGVGAAWRTSQHRVARTSRRASCGSRWDGRLVGAPSGMAEWDGRFIILTPARLSQSSHH